MNKEALSFSLVEPWKPNEYRRSGRTFAYWTIEQTARDNIGEARRKLGSCLS